MSRKERLRDTSIRLTSLSDALTFMNAPSDPNVGSEKQMRLLEIAKDCEFASTILTSELKRECGCDYCNEMPNKYRTSNISMARVRGEHYCKYCGRYFGI